VNRYFSYCRRSSEDEGHQVLSIESQQQELKRYAERENLTIIAVLEESKSAKYPGRPVFNELLKRIQRGEADGILAWHPDRLARNSLDGGTIIYLLDTGTITTLRFPTYTFENTPQGKFMLAIMFGESKYYVDALSENVRRGNRTKRERGWLPSTPPVGYLNGRSSSGEKIIVSDPERFPMVKSLWRLMLSGGFSVGELHTIAANDIGLRSRQRKRRGGNILSVNGLYRVLRNPFFAGQIAYGGEWFPGKHEAMVTVAQYEQVQTLLGNPNRARPKEHAFAYTGLIRCGFCGAGVTAEAKINRYGSHYTYYHCTHKKQHPVCAEKSIEERQLQDQVLAFLARAHVTRDEQDEALAIIEKEREKEQTSGSDRKKAASKALDQNRKELDTLTQIRYRDLIGDEEFSRQRAELLKQEAALKQQLDELSQESWIEPSRNFFLFNHRAAFWMTHGGLNEKRLILATVGSNPTLMSKKLNINARYPFVLLTKPRSSCEMWEVVRDVRIFFNKECTMYIPLLPDPDARHLKIAA